MGMTRVRIAFLCKRRYMSKDVIADRYARLYEIPYQLARLGHDVRGYCLSYGRAEEGEWQHDAPAGRLHWESRSLGRLKLPVMLGYPGRLLRRLRQFGPDVIVAASDIPHVALGAWLARRLRVPFAADLYDNFEGLGQARIPGFVPALRRAVRRADLVTTTSEALSELVQDRYGARGKLVAMPSTIDKAVFRPRDKLECRRALGLPAGARLIGTAGGLYADKGVGVLYEAWLQLATQRPDLQLVLAGPTDPALPPPAGDRVHTLGPLPHARIAELFAALDVGVIYLRDTPFGRYCFPQKAYEMLACDLPVIAARIGAMPRFLSSTPDALYAVDNAGDLARAALAMLERPARPELAIEDWAQIIARMERDLSALVSRQAA